MGRRIRYRPGVSSGPFVGAGGGREGISWTDPRMIFTIVVVWVLVLVGIVLVGYFILQYRKFQTEFGPLAEVCRGRGANVTSTYTPTQGKHPAVAATEDSGGWQLDMYFIPGKLAAQSMAETQAVLCLGKVQKIFVESCAYEDGYVVERYYYKQDVKLVEAKTGRVISVQSFTGRSASTCDEVEVFNKDRKTKRSMGTEIPTDQIQDWAATHLYIE